MYFDGLEKFNYHTVPDYWNAHYSRIIENQLAVVHLHFVHHNTIGRGKKTLVDGPVVRLNDWAMKRGNLTMAYQDRCDATTQEPKASVLHGDEKLIQGDQPIVLYRRR